MSFLHQRRTVQIALAVLVGATSSALAQEPPKPGSAATAPDTGQMAPDFTLPGATRFGLLKDPMKLSSFRGQTVVLAFFPKARTKG
jgi:peroxiredoxin Q/BCP